MTRTSERKKQGGRPPSYTQEQVYGVIARLIACGTPSRAIDASMVKQELCSAFGISPTVRPESLQKQVDIVLSDYESDEADALLRSLPEMVTASLDHFMQGAREAFALMVARQNARCQAQANNACEELRAEKRTALWRISELEAEVHRLEKNRQTLISERDHHLAEAEKLREKIRSDDEELNRLRGANELVQLLVSQLQQTGHEDMPRAAESASLQDRSAAKRA
ncbi:hypothetical protein AYJ57_15265 [Salipiger sp. CCB-MM3]|uniref:hypothetical protein n=1 Tax=Salipiger sp. CCB-MM3 TaxID=1792508 RepID=UPI00080AB4EE|nr:hypothetical protein [Salipiger sp. CCB-MM3]ANT61825.1 hypothetical protein AYJ57_15265 [Salipiger sp. CCB-MM3]